MLNRGDGVRSTGVNAPTLRKIRDRTLALPQLERNRTTTVKAKLLGLLAS